MIDRIYQNRAEFYGCSPDLFSKTGILVIPESKLSNALTLARIGSHLMLRYDPNLDLPIPQIKELDHSDIDSVMKFLEGALGQDDLSWNDPFIYHYKLDSEVPDLPSSTLEIRQFHAAELSELNAFYSECSEDDLDQVEIYLDEPDPVIFLGRMDQKIVAYVSHRYLSHQIANIGVLVLPAYRKNGFGLALVRHITNWCIRSQKIPLYIVNRSNLGSMALIQKLNYTPLVEAYRLD